MRAAVGGANVDAVGAGDCAAGTSVTPLASQAATRTAESTNQSSRHVRAKSRVACPPTWGGRPSYNASMPCYSIRRATVADEPVIARNDSDREFPILAPRKPT